MLHKAWKCVSFGACLVFAACSAPSPQAQLEARERTLMAPLKAKYPDEVMGYDFKGTLVDISIDANAVMSMDVDSEDALKAQAIRDWASAWRATHPGAHAKVTVRILDFRGTQYAKESRAI